MKRFFLVLLLAMFIMVRPDVARAVLPSPFFLFSPSEFASDADRAAIFAVLRKHATTRDYVSSRIGAELGDVAGRVGRDHLYTLPTSLKTLERDAEKCSSQTSGLIIYDGEHWKDTPADEREDMPAAIERGKMFVRGNGSACASYGIAPDGRYAGLLPQACGYDMDRAINRKIRWSGIAFFDIQAQRLLSDSCVRRGGVDAYVAFISRVVQEVRMKNHHTKISAQFSFRYTPPDRMLVVINRLRGVVDGFYIAYPSNVGPACRYCSPENLNAVLTGLSAS